MEQGSPIRFRPKQVTIALVKIATALVLISIATQIIKYEWGDPPLFGLSERFYVDAESNVPTYFASVLLLIAGSLSILIGTIKRRRHPEFSGQWLGLGVLLGLMSIDEIARFHERTSWELYSLILNLPFIEPTSVNAIPWVMPVALGILVLAFPLMRRFLLHLPHKTQRVFLVAGLLYIGGALGIELFSAWYGQRYGYQTLAYSMIATFEESLELAGVIVFIHALLDYLGHITEGIVIQVVNEEGDPSQREDWHSAQ